MEFLDEKLRYEGGLVLRRRRALLTARSLLQEKAIAFENDMRGLLRNFGLKVGEVSGGRFKERIRELVEADPDLAEIMEPLLAARRKLREEFAKLDKKVLQGAKHDEVCKRLMTVPGVGLVVSLAYVSTIDIPGRFRHSRAVGAVVGLNQSGESKRIGHVCLCGDRLKCDIWSKTGLANRIPPDRHRPSLVSARL